MIFKDYYGLLELNFTASQEEIKKAFKVQAVKWHPDRNNGVDTTSRMQNINEAYLILKDSEARSRYDVEYRRFDAFRQARTFEPYESGKSESVRQPESKKTDFQVEDDVLAKWMDSAKRQAVDLAQQTIRDFKGVSKAASQGLLEGVKQVIVWVVIINLIGLLVRGCNN